MTHIKLRYIHPLQTECVHESGAALFTDAPKDVGGPGEHFSPTDLFAASLASCMMTLMAMQAAKLGVDLKGTTAEIEKEMSTTPPRRISRITIRFRIPLAPLPGQKEKLEKSALECPVHRSIHPDVRLETEFVWG